MVRIWKQVWGPSVQDQRVNNRVTLPCSEGAGAREGRRWEREPAVELVPGCKDTPVAHGVEVGRRQEGGEASHEVDGGDDELVGASAVA